MSFGSEDPFGHPLLSGLFGAFQSAASERKGTAEVWSDLRFNAGLWQAQATGTLEGASRAQLENAGAQVLREQGIGIREVNTYRQLAGQWRSARDSLMEAEIGNQITAENIFVPPWAKTTNPAVPSRYRVRINWQVTPPEGDVFTKWSSYELTDPITSLQDVFDQARSMAVEGDSDRIIFSGGEPEITQYEIEQI